ncbi:hypothetical protein JCM10449v2_007626 [Rhodotorula kratochvilovae]
MLSALPPARELSTASSVERAPSGLTTAAPSPPALVPTAGADDDDDVLDDDDEDEDVESLLYLAQMDLIAHKSSEAMDKLERAALAGSSAACATLAGLLSRKARLANALRALELYLSGLALLLAKSVRPDPPPVDSASGDARDDDDGAEGTYFDLGRALDLIAGVTDAHRFGILNAPAPPGRHGHLPSPPDNDLEARTDDDLWRRSHIAAVSLLDHKSIAPLFHEPIEPPASAALSQSLRPSSVSRSYSHPSSTLSFGTALKGSHAALLAPDRKLKVTIAIHALYVLALQAWALQPIYSFARSTPPNDHSYDLDSNPKLLAERYWSTIVRLASPYASLGGIGIKEADELVERTQRRLESLHHQDMGAEEPWRLAKKRGRPAPRPHLPATGVVASANDRPALLLASSSPGATHELGSSARTIRPTLARAPSSSTTAGSLGGPTPRASAAKFHFGGGDVDEGEEEAETPASPVAVPVPAVTPQGDVAHSPPFALSPPRELLLSPTKPGPSNGDGTLLASAQQYPSPPDTPPTDSEARLFYPDFTRARTATSSSLSPPSSSSRLTPLSPTQRDLPRVTSVRSIASQRSTTSVLSHFKHDPLQAYLTSRLRRVASSASVCTAPPDFSGRSRIVRGKGKGRMVDPAPSELFDLPALGRARSRPAALATVEEPAAAQRKTWLSRFWQASSRAPAPAGAEGDGAAFERTRSSSAVHELQKALSRHDEASAEIVYYWGEDEEDDDGGADEEPDNGDESTPPASPSDSPPPRAPAARAHASSSIRFDDAQLSQADRLRASLTAPGTQSAARRAARQRSFLLTDPTSTPTPDTSRSRERERAARSRETSGASESSACETSADGLLAPPSPQRRRRRGSRTSTARENGEEGAPQPVPMDPLLLELERRSHIGLKTTCGACGRKGLNFPACRTCKGTYCSRECRVGEKHACRREKVRAAV